ncbi:hypothetical protein JANAI62_14680 [Jannaschia pagri]|uniref:DUF3108 domain-containing protein n=1 Tax=Jannaschia pagri TaxID=2829797 RepID=A0ABQ4NKU1_9RHOB|nr:MULTISPECIES: DUF3108 domain-containing protein [unclassified Jannaschia]GIT91013.1 hypothetical protein JANAI61_14710 [Jannaschia sp. AI_61]GIT94845.1 hypothetical protein JANAI62_14680 [Jannaschia sp. AI_62]
MPRLSLLMSAVALALATALPAAAQSLDAQYALSLRGVTGGTIAIRGRTSGGSYSVSAAAKATGLVGSLVKYAFEGSAEGRVSGGRYTSSVYREREDDDGERTGSVTRFRGTTPSSVTFDPPRPPRPYDIDPTAQRGVIDPLTALYAILQPVAPGNACGQRYELFDGRHVSRMSLGAARAASDGTITCTGEYRRLRGYSAEELAERPTVVLTFTYAPIGAGQVQISEIRSSTKLGNAVLRRK